MRTTVILTVPGKGILEITAYYNCTNELLFSYAKDSHGEDVELSAKQIEYINEKLNENEGYELQ